MSYTGRTAPGAPAQTIDLGTVTLTKLAVGPLDNNVYLLRAPDGSQLLVDAADEPDSVLSLLGDGPLTGILTTHRHGDHWRALAAVVAATGARTLAGAEDAPGLDVATDVELVDGDTVAVGDPAAGGAEVGIIALRGHTPGGVAVHIVAADGSHHLLTGDSLFPGGVGRTTDAADFRQLLGDVTARLFDRFPDAHVYPGHGWDTTLAAERPHLGEWAARGW
ncbi:MAG: MBL fold metallo-hydrolase [Actinobacteria bacterium]|nr:MAG: MBL fold metallo-hydrolase [Actinomycetota bacterium]